MLPLESIDDTVIAAGALIASIAGEGFSLGNKEKQVITDILSSISDHKKAKEAAIYGIAAVESEQGSSAVISHLAPMMKAKLNLQEKEKLISLVDEARTAMLANLPVYVEPSDYEYSFKLLKQKLGLEL